MPEIIGRGGPGGSTTTRVEDDTEIGGTRSARELLVSFRSAAGLHPLLPLMYLSLSYSRISSPFSLSVSALVQDYLGKQQTGQWSPVSWMELMYRDGTGGVGLVKVRENCHPQDLSFLSVIPRVSNFIHPVVRFSLIGERKPAPGQLVRLPPARPSSNFDKRANVLRAREAAHCYTYYALEATKTTKLQGRRSQRKTSFIMLIAWNFKISIGQ